MFHHCSDSRSSTTLVPLQTVVRRRVVVVFVFATVMLSFNTAEAVVVAPAVLSVSTTSSHQLQLSSSTSSSGSSSVSSMNFPSDYPAYNASRFPTAWFGANATNWEDESQLEAIGKYSMAILGWQHLDTVVDWTAVVYAQMEQAAIIKSRHPDLPVFVYCGYGFAFGLNAGTWPPMKSVMNDPQNSPFRNWFLQSEHGPVFTHTNCQQGHTSPGATGNRCVGFFWNMANASARTYFVDKLVAPLAASEVIDGVFFDAFNYG